MAGRAWSARQRRIRNLDQVPRSGYSSTVSTNLAQQLAPIANISSLKSNVEACSGGELSPAPIRT